MKRNIFLFLALIVVCLAACNKSKVQQTNAKVPLEILDSVPTATDTTQITNTLADLEGEYRGIVPCEDCDGTETAIMLNVDNTFTRSLTYIGKGGPYWSAGIFTWQATDQIIVLKFEDGTVARYRADEGKLSLLDDEGNIVEGYELIR